MGNKKSKNGAELQKMEHNCNYVIENLMDVSKQENKELTDQFLQECKNGVLDKETFIKFYKKLFKDAEDSEEYCELVFNGI